MADDIDIEEHDVLDNPAVKTMFPDISLLKQEIKNFEAGVQELVNNKNSDRQNVEGVGEVIDNEIKPLKQSSLTVDVEIIEVDDDLETNPPEIASLELFNTNKIILGSKPCRSLEYEEEFFEKQVKPYDVNVVLDDLKPYLDTSGRFCNECLILFPSKIALDIHIETCHASAVPSKKKKLIGLSYKRFKCTKCNNVYGSRASLYRHNKIVHRGMVQVQRIKKMLSKVKNHIKHKNQSTPNQKECFHCKTLFPTQQSLIEHLYSTLQSKKYVCKICSKNFTGIEQLKHHTLTHKTFVIVKENVQSDLNCKTTKTNEVRSKLRTLRTAGKVDSAAILNPEAETSNPAEALENIKYYRCYICSYYFRHTKSLSAHLANKHNITKDCEEMQKEKCDSLCKYCSKNYYNINSFNAHLSSSHKEHVNVRIREQENPNNFKSVGYTAPIHIKSKQDTENKGSQSMILQKNLEKNNTERFVLKSALFKCSKCDIHFISPKVARNHIEHIEMLINWKCSKCKHIFKKEDESLHEEQHKYSQEFTVHDLCPVTSSPVLFNCLKCMVHFDEDSFPKHNSVCESETPNSVYCIICDILIDNTLSKAHRAEHVSKNFKPTDFIIVNSDILANCNRIVRPKKSRAEETSNIPEQKNNAFLLRKCNEKSNIQHKMEKHSNDLLNLIYCHTCKCFLSDTDKREVHIEERCQHLEKYICKICGLILTAESYTTAHRNIHNLFKNVQLKDYHFYDLKNCEKIGPSIPEYLKCENCDVYFISKDAIFSHECSETDYLTCNFCDINLTEDAFRLHMSFHDYSKTNSKSGYYNSTREVCTRANERVSRKLETDDLNKESKTIDSKSIRLNLTKRGLNKSSTEMVSQSARKVNRAVRRSVQKISSCSKKKIKLNDSPKLVQSQSDKNDLKSLDTISNFITEKTNSAKSINLDGIVYQCRNCRVSMDTYDKVIEHCFGHYYCSEEDNKETVECQICEMSFDRTCFENHETLHLCNKDRDYFTVLYFDIFYFTSENRIWIEHVFGSLPQEQRNRIIHDSIYKYECRIKMEVIQNGPADLTVYKCDKCRSFIDGTSLYKHAENSCFKLRKHPCSVCGLPFNSSVSRIEHEKIHERSNVNSKSYRIVTFNKEEDKVINKILKSRSNSYVLYQCRNCSVAVDKSQSKKHKCCERNLKPCSACGLLLANDCYDIHILRHKELINFVQKNIKIVLFGETGENIRDATNDMVPTFTGIVYDYTFYSCSKCQICVKSNANLDKHTCSFGTNRLKCSICELYFLTSKHKHHIKLHETDPDFMRENIRLILFNSSGDIVEKHVLSGPTAEGEEAFMSEKIDSKYNHNSLPSQSTVTIDRTEKKLINTKVEEKCAKIYKCTCGLHFLDHFSFASHYKVCDPKTRVSKLNCTKCDLLFTADILFTHMIIHHGSKTQIYKFNVIDMTQGNIIYRCLKCSLHFAKVDEINEHFSACDGTSEGKDCIFCNLKFDSSSFISHNCNNVKNVNAGVEVVDLQEPLVPKTAAVENKQSHKKNRKIENIVAYNCNNVENGNTDVEVVGVHEPLIKTTVIGPDENKPSESKESEMSHKKLEQHLVSPNCNNVENENSGTEVIDVQELLVPETTGNKQAEMSPKNLKQLDMTIPNSVRLNKQEERHSMDLGKVYGRPNYAGVPTYAKIPSPTPEVMRIETLDSGSERVSTPNTFNTGAERAGVPHRRHWKVKKKWNNFVHPRQNMPRMTPPPWQKNSYQWGNETTWRQGGPIRPRAAPYQHIHGRPYL